jgi:hypothetical protein
MVSSLSVNHPFLPRKKDAVCVGLGGIRKNAAMPTIPVKIPSMRKSHLQPGWPLTPRICRIPNARNDARISAVDMAVHQTDKRTGSSRLV